MRFRKVNLTVKIWGEKNLKILDLSNIRAVVTIGNVVSE